MIEWQLYDEQIPLYFLFSLEMQMDVLFVAVIIENHLQIGEIWLLAIHICMDHIK